MKATDMLVQLVFSFNFDVAKGYMITLLHLENQRDELNAAINAAREDAREDGVPTKAVEAALRAAKGRRKSTVSPGEFQALMDQAEKLLKASDA